MASVEYGPLAVIESLGGGHDARGGTGPIGISESCVTLTRENGEVLLLTWQSGEVQWDAQSRTIIYTSFGNLNDETITIRDGDIITVGGSSLVGDVPVERDLTWLATPDPACAGEQWSVFGVLTETPTPGS
jgi:hypothetical protein